MNSPSSPRWLKPNDRLRLRLRKRIRKASQSRVLHTLDPNVVDNKTSLNRVAAKIPVNPFRCVVKEMKENYENACSESDTEGSNLPEKKKMMVNPVVVEALNEDANFGMSFQQQSAKSTESVQNNSKQWHDSLLVDWSIKTKVRFVSKTPFFWRGSFKASEEASGITGFSRCIYSNGSESECSLDTSATARLYQHSLYWVHPHLPWLTLFPRSRVAADSDKSRQPLTFAGNQALQDSLHEEWCVSFRSLYQLIKARQCAFFYLCAPTFTILFRAAGVGGCPSLHAIVSPATKSFQQALVDEGIEFLMPLDAQKNGETAIGNDTQLTQTQDSQQTQPQEMNGENEDVNQDVEECNEEETVTWLESLGVSQQDLSLINHKRKRLLNKKKNQHHSVIWVEGMQTQALVNFLVNNDLFTKGTGPLAGVPPTLLSPVAFQGATMKQLKIRQACHQRNTQVLHTLDISGPVLPSALNSLCSLFSETQNGQFSAVLSTDKATEPLAALRNSSSTPSAFVMESLKDCGLSSSFLYQVCSSKTEAPTLLTKVNVEHGLYSWNE